MRKRVKHIICSLLLLVGIVHAESMHWEKNFPAVPDKYGFAGPFAGVVGEGDSRFLVFGGGANFPYENPFDEQLNANGGQAKVWYDSLYSIQLETTGLQAKGEWKKLSTTLPQPLGYGASVSLPHRKTALFIGGSNVVDGKEVFSNAVYEVSLNAGEVKFSKVADLPVGVSYTAANVIGKNVYVFSGTSAEGEVEQAWVLNTSDKDSNKWSWKTLPWPEYAADVPARGRAHCVVGAMGGKLYVFAGRGKLIPGDKRVLAEDVNEIYQADGFRDCYEYTPGKGDAAQGTWTRIADMPVAISAAPYRAVPAGVSHLMVLGGVDLPFLKTLSDKEKYPTLNAGGQGFDHPGFPRTIWGYHTITKKWANLGSLPAEQKMPVTAPVVIDGKEFLVPSGEWSPKLRSSNVLRGEIASEKLGFGIVNWIVVIVYLMSMVGIGYWFMKKEAASSTDAYFRGGQRIPWWVAGLSIFATMLSAITFMAIPAAAYAGNWNGWIGQWPIILIVPLVVFFYLPFFRRLNITTAYEYLERRFNVASRVIASVTFMLFHIGRVAIVLYLPALALSAVTDINIYVAISVIGVLCVIYTVMGGIEAVVWTDAIQALVLIGGALLCFGLVVVKVDGGIGAVGDMMVDHGKGLTASWSLDDFSIGKASTSGIVLFIAFMFANLPSYTAGQDVVQRYVTTPSEKEAARSLWLNIAMVLVGSAIFFGLGTALFLFYRRHPEMLDPAMTSNDGILPYFIMQNLPIGVAGLIIAGVFAAAQSTISSSLNSVATAFVTDVYGRLLKPKSSDQQQLKVAQLVVILLGVIGIAVSSFIAYTKIDSAFMLFNQFIGFALGPLGGLFALGVFTKHSNGVAGLASLLIGVLSVTSVFLLELDVMPLLFGFIGFMATLISGSVLGFVFRAKPEDLQGLTIFTQDKK